MARTSCLISPQLVARVAHEARWNASFFALMGSSGVLAAIALLTSSVPVLIGAMVVAPALPPLALVAVAIAAGKRRLLLRGIAVGLAGLVAAIAAAMFVTWLVNHFGILSASANLLHRPLIEERVRPGWYSAIVALAAGVSAGIAVLKRKLDTLVGTVAAVALVPAAAAAGIAMMAGDVARTAGGTVMLLVNAVILVGVMTLVIAIARPTEGDPADQER